MTDKLHRSPSVIKDIFKILESSFEKCGNSKIYSNFAEFLSKIFYKIFLIKHILVEKC